MGEHRQATLVNRAKIDATSPIKWRDIPIMRVDKKPYENENAKPVKTQKQSVKKVTWNENLLDIMNISPRITQDKFKFPSKANSKPSDYCSHFTCRVGHPCRLTSSSTAHTSRQSSEKPSTTQLNCSPQLQKVVFSAIKHLPHQEEEKQV
eukprot:TRINITY_DN15527_c0_g1_i1.p1 TRINITY_DN15527_c0_g1~~TRINITY_DN15527_c0_g1_i1.p1  ORF type:complete len:173 (-),score=62.28 TRINITY_DN15527_c0_g1_i1:104-553(-)